ncbi:3'(2'),5'-bisphosphate nucleotidase CysQ family protein [Methylomonas methanica]|uniref:Inositol-phosphate phosphatase n=1 Tax=Methylomonas methanica (strain DSM 25384 / MC09) TaxID=857087 RepID=F9ZVQ5_METMM|nr:inositol monophosphatase family protein [Methylomonas methanica]AEF99533.1 Inositol-phosphate phosphatase [Methylomonas methanica MC09]
MRLSATELFMLGQCAISAAYQAGHLIADYAQRKVSVDTKRNGGSLAAQVVTEVDHLSQEIILQILRPSCDRFDLALLSEESPDDGERLRKDYFWCIDPLDGTLPFIEALPGYSVSIALLARDGAPLIGVVYDPLTQTLFHAITGRGAWRNRQSLTLPATTPSAQQTLSFLTDKSFVEDPLYPATLTALKRIAQELGYAGAELKLQGGAAMNACQVLAMPPACYFKFPKPQIGGGSIWDYAATSCLFRETNASVSDMGGKPLVLNPTGTTFMNHCGVLYCADPAIAEKLISVYRDLTQS